MENLAVHFVSIMGKGKEDMKEEEVDSDVHKCKIKGLAIRGPSIFLPCQLVALSKELYFDPFK